MIFNPLPYLALLEQKLVSIPLPRHTVPRDMEGVETSLDAAHVSVCATNPVDPCEKCGRRTRSHRGRTSKCDARDDRPAACLCGDRGSIDPPETRSGFSRCIASLRRRRVSGGRIAHLRSVENVGELGANVEVRGLADTEGPAG